MKSKLALQLLKECFLLCLIVQQERQFEIAQGLKNATVWIQVRGSR